MNKIITPPGVSGRSIHYDTSSVTLETVADELALLSLGDFEPLDLKVNTNQLMQELDRYRDDWTDYLPRTDRPNNRKGLSLTTIEGIAYNDTPSMPEIIQRLGRIPKESEISFKTEVYDHCQSLHNILESWEPLGRTFFIKSDIGGYFVPHRDHPTLPRDTFRLICFVNNCGPLDYDWWMDNKKLQIEPGRFYYVNTKKTHRTISWVNDSIHLILNVPFTSKNVSNVLAHLQHRH
jgi:hypothetical protein